MKNIKSILSLILMFSFMFVVMGMARPAVSDAAEKNMKVKKSSEVPKAEKNNIKAPGKSKKNAGDKGVEKRSKGCDKKVKDCANCDVKKCPYRDRKVEAVTEGRGLVGKVLIVGTSNFSDVVLQHEKSKNTTALSGSLLGELKNLQGMRIKIWGEPAEIKTRSKRESLNVKGYKVLAAPDGRVPYLGVILLKGTELSFKAEDGKVYKLDAMRISMEKFKNADGSKVWIIGEVKGETLKIKKYKILN